MRQHTILQHTILRYTLVACRCWLPQLRLLSFLVIRLLLLRGHLLPPDAQRCKICRCAILAHKRVPARSMRHVVRTDILLLRLEVSSALIHGNVMPRLRFTQDVPRSQSAEEWHPPMTRKVLRALPCKAVLARYVGHWRCSERVADEPANVSVVEEVIRARHDGTDLPRQAGLKAAFALTLHEQIGDALSLCSLHLWGHGLRQQPGPCVERHD